MGYLAESESGHGMIERDIPHDYFMFKNTELLIQRKITLKRKLQRWKLKAKWVKFH